VTFHSKVMGLEHPSNVQAAACLLPYNAAARSPPQQQTPPFVLSGVTQPQPTPESVVGIVEYWASFMQLLDLSWAASPIRVA
jgi:hypothetical protein